MEPTMAQPRCVDHRRRDFFRIMAGATAMLGLAARPLAALAQTGGGAPLKIGTIGAGHIGSTVGSLWVKAGHPVMFSSRHPEELKDLVAGLGPLAQAGTTAQAIAFADVVLLAFPYSAMPQIAHDFAHDLAAKSLVFDATDPIPKRDGDVAVRAREKGAGLAAAEALPGVRLVRAFNAINYLRLPDDAHRTQERVGEPMAGDDAGAIAIASRLVRDIGLEPVVIGPLAMGKYLIPGSPLGGEHSPAEIKQIVAKLNA
jgi:hypothetical protein